MYWDTDIGISDNFTLELHCCNSSVVLNPFPWVFVSGFFFSLAFLKVPADRRANVCHKKSLGLEQQKWLTVPALKSSTVRSHFHHTAMCAVIFGQKSQNHRNVTWKGLWKSSEPPKMQLVPVCTSLFVTPEKSLAPLSLQPSSGCQLLVDCSSSSSSAKRLEIACDRECTQPGEPAEGGI